MEGKPATRRSRAKPLDMRVSRGEPPAEFTCVHAPRDLNFRARRIFPAVLRDAADQSWPSGNDIRIEFSRWCVNCAKSGGIRWLNAQPWR